jgi:hypothetical protein
VIALKLAEAQFMRRETEERPILLLDDILSELDPVRRGFVLGQAGRAGQTLITTTDLDDFGPDLLERATLVRVERGAIAPVAHDGRKAGPASFHEGSTNGTTYPEPETSLRRVAERPSESPTG